MILKVISKNGSSIALIYMHTFSVDGARSQADGEVRAFCVISLQRTMEAEQER